MSKGKVLSSFSTDDVNRYVRFVNMKHITLDHSCIFVNLYHNLTLSSKFTIGFVYTLSYLT